MLLLLVLKFNDGIELLDVSDELLNVQYQPYDVGFYLLLRLVVADQVVY